MQNVTNINEKKRNFVQKLKFSLVHFLNIILIADVIHLLKEKILCVRKISIQIGIRRINEVRIKISISDKQKG